MEFFPELRWRGLRVDILGGWDPDSAEPVLTWLSTTNRELSEFMKTPQGLRETDESLKEAGWHFDQRDGPTLRRCHINDLEPIPGEPPESLYT